MEREQISALIAQKIAGQGNQVDASCVLPVILNAILDEIGSVDGQIGELASLHTDHKSALVEAINEIFDVLETPELVVSMNKTTAEMKAIYDECARHPQLAKNVVFYDPESGLYYKVNGFRQDTDSFIFHIIVKEGAALHSTTIRLLSTGVIVGE